MKNTHQAIKILESQNELATIRFVDSGLTMSLPTELLKQKVQGGFYNVIDTQVKVK